MVKTMKRTSEFKNKGEFYLISTPIGNLSDMSERMVETLKSLDFLYCEDTRVTKKLLTYLKIDKLSVDSYHDHSSDDKIDKIVEKINSGLKVGLVSDAGTPIISDPGYEVVKRLIDEDIRVVPIPGITAEVTALTLSSLPPKPYMFYGFLSQNDKKRKEELKSIKDYPFTIIFYESPFRVKNTIKEMYEILGERKASLSRELTKIYEETIYLNLSEYNELDENLKGEMVIVVDGNKCVKEDISLDEAIKLMDELIKKENLSIKDASKRIALNYDLKSSDLYNEYVRVKK